MLELLLLTISHVSALSGCDPIDPSRCYLPAPNDYWRYQDQTGTWRMNFSSSTFPSDRHGRLLDPNEAGFNVMTGWPAISGIATYFANLSITNLPPYYHMEQSLSVDCPSVLLDTVTGQGVAHFVELDWSSMYPRDQNTPDKWPQLLIMWPGQRLMDNRRYIVAYRNLTDTNGKPIQPSTAFEALRDNITTTDPDVEQRRALFNDMFNRLAAFGWPRNTILLCWDFTTATLDDTTGRLVSMRDDAFQRTANGIKYEIKNVTDNYSQYITRHIEGRLTEPYYTDSTRPGAHLVIDPVTNKPAFQGYNIEADFTILIPQSLVNPTTQEVTIGTLLQYGHGLFGSRSEVESTYLQQQANEYGYVMIASDWIGMSENDIPAVTEMMLFNFSDFKIIPERTSQGMLRALLLMRLLKQGTLAKDPAMTFYGKPVVNPSADSFYYGNSNGGILGSIYNALSTDVKRGCLGVGGGPYTLMLPRSKDFTPFYEILKERYSDSLDRIALVLITQIIWSRTCSGGYMTHITSDPLPNTPAKDILLQHGLGDAQVSYVSVYTLGRSIGATMFQSNVHEEGEELYGFPMISDTAMGSKAFEVTWKFEDTPPSPETDIPPRYNDTHEGPRRQQTAIDMMYYFFKNGSVINTCGGPCLAPPMEEQESMTEKVYRLFGLV